MNKGIYFLIILLVILANILHFTMKNILSKNGYKVTYWYGHLKDYSNFFHLIKKEENRHLKVRYVILFCCLIVATISFLIVAGLIITKEY